MKGPSSLTATVVFLSAGHSRYLGDGVGRVLAGARQPERILLIWSGPPSSVPALPREVSVLTIPEGSFDHGGTRQLALEKCQTDLLVFLTDDAVPVSEDWLRHLCVPFDDPGVAAVYGRQIARDDAPLFEKVFRSVKYPETDRELLPADAGKIAAALMPVSNANAAYRTDTLRAVGGFPHPVPFAEDVAAARAVLRAGWRVLYSAEATVWHSHQLSLRQMYGRGRMAGLVRAPAGAGRDGTRRAASRLVRAMLREGWRAFGVAGVLAVIEGVAARALGHASGLLARPSPGASDPPLPPIA